MSIEARLYAALTGYSPLAALIGDRAYPIQLPEKPTLPSITYLRVSTEPVQHRDNQMPTYSKSRIQIDGWATDFDGMIALRKQIRQALGVWQLNSVPRVDMALLASDRDVLEAEPIRYRCMMDYMVSYQED